MAFDVYESIMGGGLKAYALRTGSMVLTTAGFLGLVLYYQQSLLKAVPRKDRFIGLGRFLNYAVGPSGFVPRLTLPWLAYFRPGFHPWDHDNHELLAAMPPLMLEIEHAASIRAATNGFSKPESAMETPYFAPIRRSKAAV